MKTLPLFLILLGCVLGSSDLSLASDPPGEAFDLPSLLKEARARNIEIQEAEKERDAAAAFRSQASAPYFPEFGVEGGFESARSSAASLSNPFYYGYGRINLYRGGRDSAQVGIRSAEEEFQNVKTLRVKEKVERKIASLYYELLFLRDAIHLKEEQLSANQNQMKMALKKKQAGFTSEADVLEFQLREATLNSDLILLKQDEIKVFSELKPMIGRTSDDPMVIQGELVKPQLTKTTEDLHALAKVQRIDLKEAEKNSAIAQLEYASAFGEYLPKVDLESKFGNLTVSEQEVSGNPAWNVQLKVSFPLFSGFETRHLRSARAALVSKSDLTVARSRLEASAQIQSAVVQFRTLENRLSLEEKNLERARRYYEITLGEYKRGVKNSPDLAGAAERLFDARLRNLRFQRDLNQAKVALLEATGSPLGGF